MLTLADQAQTVVRTMTQDPQAPESAGLRIAPGDEGLELMGSGPVDSKTQSSVIRVMIASTSPEPNEAENLARVT